MGLSLVVTVEASPGATELVDGWRGLIDFGETWSLDDAALWPESEVPIGQPLTYGCELRWDNRPSGKATLRLWFGDERRSVMTPGASFVLRDGGTARATGRIVA